MKYIIAAWSALSVISLAVYAFTGVGAWAPLDPQEDGGLRFMLLFFAHLLWIPALAHLVEKHK